MRAALCIALLVTAAQAAAFDALERWHQATDRGQPQTRGSAVADFDGDGLPDLAIMFRGEAGLLRVYGVDAAGAWRLKQELLLDARAQDDTESLAPFVDVDGERRLLVVDDNGRAQVLEGWPLRLRREFGLPFGPVGSVRVGDVDADGDLEAVVPFGAAVLIASMETGATEAWIPRYDAQDVRLVSLDADPALEIVVADQPGVVLDGATRAVEWDPASGFGAWLALPEGLATAGPHALATGGQTGLGLFGLAPPAVLPRHAAANVIGLAACDGDGDGSDELWYSTHDGRHLNEYVVATGSIRARFPLDFPSARFIEAADFDGDGRCEVVAGTGQGEAHRGDALRVFDPRDGRVLHAARPGHAPSALFRQARLADRAGVIAVYGSKPVRLRALDAGDGSERWSRTAEWLRADDLYLEPQKLLSAQLDDDAADEIVLMGNHGAAVVRIFDGADGATELAIGGDHSGPMPARNVRGALLFDRDLDGRPELLLGTVADTTGTAGAKLHLFSLADGALLWESPAFGPTFQEMADIALVQADADPAWEVMAVLPEGLRWHDAASGQFEGEAPLPWAPWPATAALAVEGGGSVLLARGNEAIRYDAATRTELGRFAVLDEIAALGELPGAPDRVLLASGTRWRVHALIDGSVPARSPVIGGFPGQPHAIAEARGWRVASFGPIGHFMHDLAPLETVFLDGFGD